MNVTTKTAMVMEPVPLGPVTVTRDRTAKVSSCVGVHIEGAASLTNEFLVNSMYFLFTLCDGKRQRNLSASHLPTFDV